MITSYVYPATLTYDKNGISVFFPDFPGCMTCGDSDTDALNMAEDALTGWLEIALEKGQSLPVPTPLLEVCKSLKSGQSAVLVRATPIPPNDSAQKKSVNKMVTLPQWLINEGKEAGINFSQTLQEALMDKLGITSAIKRRKVS